jgi:hypothetical protein
MGDGLAIRVLRAIRGEPLLEVGLDPLNLASRRPTPFNGTGFLQAFLDHDEFGGPGVEPLLLAAVEGGRLVGFLALRRRPARTLGRTEARLEFLVTHDNDRPSLAARPEDEARCAEAFVRHLAGRRDWQVLELANLEEGSPLLAAATAGLRGARLRVLEGLATAIIPTAYPDLEAWFRTLKKGWRHTVGRLGRRCLAAGRVEAVGSAAAEARLPLLELYLDLERRSWKRGHGLGRTPARTAFHRALCAPEQPLRLSTQLVLLDGVPVAGMILGDFPGTLYGMETSYDAAYQALGPGNLMSVLTVREAIRRGAPALNLFGDFGYYKGNWGAELAPSSTLQAFRPGSAHWLRSIVGDLRRRLGVGRKGGGRFNEVKREVEASGEVEAPAAALPDRAPARALAERILGELEARGVALDRLAGDALLAALPFEGPRPPPPAPGPGGGKPPGQRRGGKERKDRPRRDGADGEGGPPAD